MYILYILTLFVLSLPLAILGYAFFFSSFLWFLRKCLHYVNLVNESKYFQITRFWYFMLVFNSIMCFLEKDGEISCSKTKMEKE